MVVSREGEFAPSGRYIPPSAEVDAGELTFPGSGDPGEGCGVPKTLFCRSCGATFTVPHNCMARECPNCYTAWAMREGATAATRHLAGIYKNHWDLSGLESQRSREVQKDPLAGDLEHRDWDVCAYHVTLSVRWAPEVLTPEWIRKLRPLVYEVAKAHGAYGGTCVLHSRDDHDPGIHAHLVIWAGYLIPGGGRGEQDRDRFPFAQEDSAELIWKVIPHEGHWTLPDHRAIKDCIGYSLTHALIHPDLHALTWWGAWSYNKLSDDTVLDLVERGIVKGSEAPGRLCPRCGSRDTVPNLIIDWTGPPDTTHWTLNTQAL